MKKAWKVAAIVGMVVVLAAGASVVFAQGENPNPPGDGTNPCSPRGPFERHLDGDQAPTGPRGERPEAEGDHSEMHALMLSSFADALGMSIAEFESQLQAEKGPMGVATAQGLSQEEAQSLFEQARADAIQQALEQGLFDAEQAQRMLEHMEEAGPRMRRPHREGEAPGGHGRRGPIGQDDAD